MASHASLAACVLALLSPCSLWCNWYMYLQFYLLISDNSSTLLAFLTGIDSGLRLAAGLNTNGPGGIWWVCCTWGVTNTANLAGETDMDIVEVDTIDRLGINQLHSLGLEWENLVLHHSGY